MWPKNKKKNMIALPKLIRFSGGTYALGHDQLVVLYALSPYSNFVLVRPLLIALSFNLCRICVWQSCTRSWIILGKTLTLLTVLFVHLGTGLFDRYWDLKNADGTPMASAYDIGIGSTSKLVHVLSLALLPVPEA